MKANHTLESNNHPCAVITIKIVVTAEHIAKELWHAVYYGHINPNVFVAKGARARVDKLVKERFEGYGYAAYDMEHFEVFDMMSSLEKYQHYRMAKDIYPDFFEGLDINELTA